MIAFVTGATAGFGEAVVKKFTQEGHLVVATGRREARLKHLKNDKVYTAVLDVQDLQAVEKVVEQLPAQFQNVDVLVNNAGLALGMEPAQKASMDDWNVMVDTNVKGVLNCTHVLLPKMIKQHRGHIINLGSVAGEFPYPNGNVYGATKAFVHQFSLNLRADLLGTNVRVTCVEPGMCGGTEFSDVRFKGDKEKAKTIYKDMKPLLAEDIAETIYWIASRPAHVNINVISVMPVQQAFSPFAVNRNKE